MMEWAMCTANSRALLALCSGSSSKDNNPNETVDARRSRTNNALKAKMEIELHDRKILAKDNRKLAESAGQMLHTLIIQGSRGVKKIIISAIIEQVCDLSAACVYLLATARGPSFRSPLHAPTVSLRFRVSSA